jgi:hypothetical protein
VGKEVSKHNNLIIVLRCYSSTTFLVSPFLGVSRFQKHADLIQCLGLQAIRGGSRSQSMRILQHQQSIMPSQQLGKLLVAAACLLLLHGELCCWLSWRRRDADVLMLSSTQPRTRRMNVSTASRDKCSCHPSDILPRTDLSILKALGKSTSHIPSSVCRKSIR